MATKTSAPTRPPIGRVGQRRQVVIPREISDALNIREGDFVAFTKQSNGVLIKPKKPIDADDVLTSAEEKKVRHGMKQVKEGKTRPWAQIKDELGL